MATKLKTIDKNIQTISTSMASVNTLIHDTGVMILEHAKEHRNCTRALTLVQKMPRSFRKQMLVDWFHAFSPIRVIEKNAKVGITKESLKTFVPWDIEGAKANPFYTLEENNTSNKAPLTSAEVYALVPQFISQLEKKLEKGKIAENASGAVEAVKAYLEAMPQPQANTDTAPATKEQVEQLASKFDTLDTDTAPATKAA